MSTVAKPPAFDQSFQSFSFPSEDFSPVCAIPSKWITDWRDAMEKRA